jgi:hypothetical protein
MVSVLVSGMVQREFEPQSGHAKDYAIGSRCFSSMHAALRRNSKDWLGWNQNKV